MNATVTEQLVQLATATWDGGLISKQGRDWLVRQGYAFTLNGWNLLTEKGLRAATDLHLIASGRKGAR